VRYLKAFYGAAVAGLGSTQVAYTATGGHIGWAEGITIAIVTLTAFAGVWGVPNAGAK
jgi:hypothetical protein